MVAYTFAGFSAPVDRPNTMNVSKAGQAIPLKWRLKDALNGPIRSYRRDDKGGGHGLRGSASLDSIEEYATASPRFSRTSETGSTSSTGSRP